LGAGGRRERERKRREEHEREEHEREERRRKLREQRQTALVDFRALLAERVTDPAVRLAARRAADAG
jgi:hypothetical protein